MNVNVLARSGPEAVEPLSGMSRLTAIPVEVRRAEGRLDPTSWTGRRPEREEPISTIG